MPDQDSRAQVVLGGRILAQHGNADLVWGHLAIRDPSGRGVWLKGSGLGFDEIAAENVQLVGFDGQLVEGTGSVHLERYIHTEVMRARPDVGCVIHTHPESAVTFASLGVPLQAVAHEATLFTPPDIARFTQTGELIRTMELGRAVADSLGQRNALLLVNHGSVVVGRDVAEAVFSAVMLEKACRMQLAALSAAPSWPLHVSDDQEALRKRDTCYSPTQMRHGWEYLRRRAERPAQ